jgi:y4mF family transcriptional regulator
MLDPATFGRHVRTVRKQQDLTQTDLALLADVGVRFLVDLENGKETCQLGLALRVMQALGIELEMHFPDHDHRDHEDLSIDVDDFGEFRP